MADHRLNRPPTQSRKPKTRSGAMPKAAVAGRLVDSAARCAPACASPTPTASQDRARAAFAIVSCVAKVLEATRTSVVRGSSVARSAAQAWASTFAR